MLCVAVFVLFSVLGINSQNDSAQVLVLIENIAVRDTHSNFFKSLTDRNYHLTYKYADDSTLNLKKFGEYAYQHVIIFAPSTREFGGYINVRALTDFVDNGGNIIVAAGPNIGEALREFAVECGVEFAEDSAHVIDHNNYDQMDEGDHTFVIASPDDVLNVPVITGTVKKPILYRGIGMTVDQENPLLMTILHGSATSYSHTPEKSVSEYPTTVGKNTALVAALQARNDARVMFVGSLDFFSDDFDAPVHNVVSGKRADRSNNAEFVNHLVRWTFKESGVLRVRAVSHNKVGENGARSEYTIQDDIVYNIDIETMDANGDWKDFVANDVQVELIRIDPFIRQNLTLKGHGYETRMKLPDVYGVFKLVVDYHRHGYTRVMSSTQISVRPFTHTQYERFITSAYPYYASAISMMAGVFVFSFVYLYLRDGKKSKAE